MQRDNDLRELALNTVREKDADFGPTFAAEMLRDWRGLTVSREALRRWMTVSDRVPVEDDAVGQNDVQPALHDKAVTVSASSLPCAARI